MVPLKAKHSIGGRQLKRGSQILALVLSLLTISLHMTDAVTGGVEVAALRAVKRQIGDVYGRLSNWNGDDPCGSGWRGVYCVDVNGTQYVKELRLLNMNFTGTLAPDFGNFTHLKILDVMWNNITGSIPPEIGNLGELYLLLLNGNKLTGSLPPELGNLVNLNRIQIDENNISGPVPTSFQNLNQAQHFHMNNNSLSGSIPKELGRLESLVHLLLDNNNLTGELPPELANISTLLILQLDNNHFTSSIPSNYSNMVNLTKMSLRNCNLTGTVSDLSRLTSLRYLDLSHNKLSGTLPSGGSLSTILRTIDISYNQLDGPVPLGFLQVPNLEFLILRDNKLDGNITVNDIQHAFFRESDSLLVLDFENNNLTAFVPGGLNSVPNVTFRLFGNPVCSDASALPPNVCTAFNGSNTDLIDESTNELAASCQESTCDVTHNQELNYGLLIQQRICQCAYPLEVGYRLKSPGFTIFEPYEDAYQIYLSSGLNLSSYQVNVSEYAWEPGPRLGMTIKLFPSREIFNNSEVSRLYETFTTWSMPDNDTFGPYEVLFFNIGYPYNNEASQKSLSGGAIAGIVIGTAVFTAIVVGAAMFIIVRRCGYPYGGPFKQMRHHQRIKVAGVKDFTYEEMAKATNNFDDSVQIGQGGYGRVYKATLADGVVAAVKRAEEGSLQGAKEFYTELELLSRVHHRNLVSLLGFCDDQGEQMLVYEFMENGTLREQLNAKSKVPLDFPTRIQIALGSARGILYLHTEANPPIYHRDIKTSNILLDKKRRAKVADFGLSKLAPVSELEGAAGGYVSTVVKGTPGYLDPEYFLTHKLTDKSDVYSFGVVLLELVTGMQSISHGKNLVREVNLVYEAGMMLSIVDPQMGSYPAECLEPLVRLAISCCEHDPDCRPSMAEVVRQLEAIWRQTPVHESMTSFEMSKDTDSTAPKANVSGSKNPYISSDIDGSGLISGTILNVAPR